MRNEILFFVMLLCAVSCRGTPETVADPPAYSEDRSQLDRFLAEDFATLGHGFWIAYPLDPLPNGEFKLTFYDPTIPNSASSQGSPIHRNSAQLMLKMDADMERYTAVRVIRGIAFDQWPSVAQLENALRTQGWTEVTGRPGLWRRPK